MPLVPAVYRRGPRLTSSWTPVETPFAALTSLVAGVVLSPVTSSTPSLAPVCAITDTYASPLPSSASELRDDVHSAMHCHPLARLEEVSAQRSRPSPNDAA